MYICNYMHIWQAAGNVKNPPSINYYSDVKQIHTNTKVVYVVFECFAVPWFVGIKD